MKSKFLRANKLLGYELNTAIDDGLQTYFSMSKKKDGIDMLRTIHRSL